MPTLLFISRCPPLPLHFGDRLIVWHLARELHARGVTIDLIALANRPQDWDEIGAYMPLFRSVTLIEETPRTPLHYLRRVLDKGARFPQRAEDAWHPAMWHAIHTHLMANQYDALHLFGGLHVYEFLHALGGQPAVITPYESYTLLLERRLIDQPANIGARLRLLLARALESWMYAPYQHVVVLAEADRAKLASLSPHDALEVIPNGVDLDYFQPLDMPRDPATLLFVGNYEYAPNLEAARCLVNEIFPRIRHDIPEAKLMLVGNAPPPDLLARADERIIVTGRVDDLRPYYARASAFVCPLLVGAGMKNKVLEALAMATPLIATPLSVDGIAVTHGYEALIVDYDDIATQTIALLRDPARRAQLGTAGREVIRTRYSWHSVADHYWRLYGF